MRADDIIGLTSDRAAYMVADLSMGHGATKVFLVQTGGHRRVIKWFSKAKHFGAERDALAGWARDAIGDRIPRLINVDESRQTLTMSELSGDVVQSRLPSATTAEKLAWFTQAGEITKALHSSGQPGESVEIARPLQARLDQLLGGDDDFDLRLAEQDGIRQLVADVGDDARAREVWCHGDNSPRNWMVDADGRLSFFDFQMSGRDVAFADFARLTARYFIDDTELRDAFFAGYGAPNLAQVSVALKARLGVTAISVIRWAQAHHDPEFEAEARRTIHWLLQQ